MKKSTKRIIENVKNFIKLLFSRKEKYTPLHVPYFEPQFKMSDLSGVRKAPGASKKTKIHNHIELTGLSLVRDPPDPNCLINDINGKPTGWGVEPSFKEPVGASKETGGRSPLISYVLLWQCVNSCGKFRLHKFARNRCIFCKERNIIPATTIIPLSAKHDADLKSYLKVLNK